MREGLRLSSGFWWFVGSLGYSLAFRHIRICAFMFERQSVHVSVSTFILFFLIVIRALVILD